MLYHHSNLNYHTETVIKGVNIHIFIPNPGTTVSVVPNTFFHKGIHVFLCLAMFCRRIDRPLTCGYQCRVLEPRIDVPRITSLTALLFRHTMSIEIGLGDKPRITANYFSAQAWTESGNTHQLARPQSPLQQNLWMLLLFFKGQ
jgi:hypothetical protein